jgi:hypothetical protein
MLSSINGITTSQVYYKRVGNMDGWMEGRVGGWVGGWMDG